MRVMTIVGTRPEFIQTAPFSAYVRQRGHVEILVHTGQHYDANMSDVFFEDLGLPDPDLWLGVGGGSHAEQTGEMLIQLEKAMLGQRPDVVVVFGDTNSTVAGALAAVKLSIPVAHIEAGLRSFDRAMPEEINRVATDHLSDVLFAPTEAAVDNLRREGLAPQTHLVGDVRVDLLNGLQASAFARWPELRGKLGLRAGQRFALATIHRASNTDEMANLSGIVAALNTMELPVVLPVHPRLRKMLTQMGLTLRGQVIEIDPVGYLDMLTLLEACTLVITDSGGLQKEAYMLRRPIVTVRTTTEWIETVEAGWNRLCPTDPAAIHAAVAEALRPLPVAHPAYYGSVGVCERIVAILEHLTDGQREPLPGAPLQGQSHD